MKAVTIRRPGGAEMLALADVAVPEIRPDEVLIDVAAAGVNRADLLQRQGRYDPPPGESVYPGLEVSGTIAALGAEVGDWSIGDEVCALLSGGGYAQQVAVPAGQVLPVPDGVTLADAAALPEVTCTVWSSVFLAATLRRSEVFLVHGGASGIGTMAIQLAREFGARVAVTAGSQRKLDACQSLGAEILVNYNERDFVKEVEAVTAGRGVNVILDNMGAAYLERNVNALAHGGRLVIIGRQGGGRAELDIGTLLRKRASVIGTSLRARPIGEKAAIVASVREHVWPLLEAGRIVPVIHERFPLVQAADAHRALENGHNIGKILLTVG